VKAFSSPSPDTHRRDLEDWIDSVARLTEAADVRWCDGSPEEWRELRDAMLRDGELLPLPPNRPESYLHRSHPNDVARVEHLTYICTPSRDDAGPNNNWMDPKDAHSKLDGLFRGAMRGRVLYVVPYAMGPLSSPATRFGIELTDSRYVVANMRVMTRMGRAARDAILSGTPYVRGEHALGGLDPERRFIMHFPRENRIRSIGSGYGGNALLGKKCHALRIASWQAREEGWLAEHMLLVEIRSPEGRVDYVAAAFPSACGKTNLAMLQPPAGYEGWSVRTLGDDIAWIHPGADGRLWAINPEAGYFGVVPGTSAKTNPNAFRTIARETIFTNVALTAEGEPWWEGLEAGRPAVDWQGRPYDPQNGPAAHPNSRFTVPARNNPAWSPHSEDPQGVPLTAILFGGRRARLAPLVYEAHDWVHGVFVGASVSSETTAAATGAVGVVRRDPMAMLPFCGYHFGDYWAHWLKIGRALAHPPRIFHVNWFRQDPQGKYLWPGFGENLRVLRWILDRCHNRQAAVETPIGKLPRPEDLDLKGLTVSEEAVRELLRVDPGLWSEEIEDLAAYLNRYRPRVPAELQDLCARLSDTLRQQARKPSAGSPSSPHS
jgi:phosphoenolpyruvate carboxykinase (GTP)